MHTDKANLANLTSLWKKYGYRRLDDDVMPVRCINTSWPYRYWFDCETRARPNPVNNQCVLSELPNWATVALWPSAVDSNIEQILLQNSWHVEFTQTAMCLALDGKGSQALAVPPDLDVVLVDSVEGVRRWVAVASEAFGYGIASAVIEQLLGHQDIKILLGYQGPQVVASALLYKTGDVIGVHQVGVKPACQGLGIARGMMRVLLPMCVKWGGRYAVLQASEMGQALYESMGFVGQFTIKNYQQQSPYHG